MVRSPLRAATLALFLGALAPHASAANTRASLAALTAALRTNPSDAALREKVIKLAATLAPAPAIPEQARRAMVKGAVFQKEAKDDDGYAKVEAAYRRATDLAPWWADAYYNLSIAQELRKDYLGAQSSLRFFLLAAPPSEARDGQDRLYRMEAKAELASDAAAEAAKKTIVPGVGIGALRLGMTEAQAVAALGRPTSRDPLPFHGAHLEWAGKFGGDVYPEEGLNIIRTDDPAYKTKEGAAVGLTTARVTELLGAPDREGREGMAGTMRFPCYRTGIVFSYLTTGSNPLQITAASVFPPARFDTRCK